jgi:hypothetical protein
MFNPRCSKTHHRSSRTAFAKNMAEFSCPHTKQTQIDVAKILDPSRAAAKQDLPPRACVYVSPGCRRGTSLYVLSCVFSPIPLVPVPAGGQQGVVVLNHILRPSIRQSIYTYTNYLQPLFVTYLVIGTHCLNHNAPYSQEVRSQSILFGIC